VMPDRIEAGSYACAAAVAGGEVELTNVDVASMGATLTALREAGVGIEECRDSIVVSSDGQLKPLTLTTAPYPGFATDMQA
ncbi:UDP-N-acetylglucosamine 1-carboxyvinyltransferase, partial [Enterococcus faecium]